MCCVVEPGTHRDSHAGTSEEVGLVTNSCFFTEPRLPLGSYLGEEPLCPEEEVSPGWSGLVPDSHLWMGSGICLFLYPRLHGWTLRTRGLGALLMHPSSRALAG